MRLWKLLYEFRCWLRCFFSMEATLNRNIFTFSEWLMWRWKTQLRSWIGSNFTQSNALVFNKTFDSLCWASTYVVARWWCFYPESTSRNCNQLHSDRKYRIVANKMRYYRHSIYSICIDFIFSRKIIKFKCNFRQFYESILGHNNAIHIWRVRMFNVYVQLEQFSSLSDHLSFWYELSLDISWNLNMCTANELPLFWVHNNV